MKRITSFLVRLGEPLLWLGFLASIALTFDRPTHFDGTTIAGLFVLAAIGVRATRSDRAQAPEATDGGQ